MEVIGYDEYLDGGTAEIKTNIGTYCIDYRLGSQTKGKLYLNMPKKDNSNIIFYKTDELFDELILALAEYEDKFYQTSINQIIELYKNNKT